MAYLIIIITILSVIHLIYESTILPNFRLQMRYKLFALRDRLRMLKINDPNSINDEEFNYLQESANTAILFLRHLSISSIFQYFYEVKKNADLGQRIQSRQKLIKNCANEEYQRIAYEIAGLTTLTFVANSLMLLLLLLLPILIVIIASHCFSKAKYLLTRIKDFIGSASTIPEETVLSCSF